MAPMSPHAEQSAKEVRALVDKAVMVFTHSMDEQVFIVLKFKIVKFDVDTETPVRASNGHFIKFIGATLFSVGHGMQCVHKGSAEYTDWGYILACTPCLNIAFGGAFLGRSCPLSLLASGLLLHVAYLPLLLRALLSGAPKLLPGIGVLAAALLTWTGSIATLLDRSLLQASPLLPMPVFAMLTSCSFGLGNSLKLQRLLEAQEPVHQAFVGQVLKVLASSFLITGNSLGLGWHNVRVRRCYWALSIVMATTLRTLASAWKPRARKALQDQKCR
ncbi:Slc27a4 [Symbiodinium pilosum]|uniref:Slc27a4 protein n=1 Tax=Symbiodinium pilosum TaxID=2952 RepID=A0A812XAD5_SYMPI|nr:Slc27a4 [Symbiodinium pilosum]